MARRALAIAAAVVAGLLASEADAAEPLQPLSVPGFADAVVVEPEVREPGRPLLIAAHGAGDTPEWHCQLWAKLTRGQAFVLCPRGVRMSWATSGYYYPNHHRLEREVLASVKALGHRYGGWVDASRAVYAGYSQGATMGALMAVKHPSLFGSLVLIEGGFDEWSVPVAQSYARGGASKVGFVCGRQPCNEGARRSAYYARRGGLQTRVEYVSGAGHTSAGPVAGRLQGVLEWMVADDARWRSW